MGSKVWSAAHYSLRPSSHFSHSLSSGNDSLIPLLDLWERRHLTRGALCNYTGDIELDQPWRKGALLWFRVARFLSGFVRRRLLRVCQWFHFHQKARESLALIRLRKLDGGRPSWIVRKSAQAEETGWKPSQLARQRVGRTREAEEPGSRCSHLHQVGEEFLNSEVASEVPAVLPAGRVCGTGGIRGRMQRTSSARLWRGRSLPPWTTETPLASVPRGDGNEGRGCVGAGFSDGVSDHRSGLKATHFPSLPCFPFRCPFKRVVRRLSTPRCVQEREAESIPPIVPVRGYVELVRKFMQGDYCIGRGSRDLKPSVFGNPFKVAVHGRAGAIRRYEDMLRKNDVLLKRLPQLSGIRLVCHCRADQACHADSIVQPRRHHHSSSAQRRSAESTRQPARNSRIR